MGIERERESQCHHLTTFSLTILIHSFAAIMINVFAFCHFLNTVVWLVSLQRQTFPSLTMNHTTTTPTNTNYFSKLDNATHCLSLSLTMNPLILTMSPTAANLLLLCTHPLSHIAPPHLPLKDHNISYISLYHRPSCTHL